MLNLENPLYHITKISNTTYLVFGKDYSRIDLYKKNVESELRQKGFLGHVIFDLLLSNGDNTHRFFKAWFDGNIIEPLKRESKVDGIVREKVKEYVSKNAGLLEKSVLSQKEIENFYETIERS